jgi:predicted metal-dependent enzyme (double-stranded beta helix superfamily)
MHRPAPLFLSPRQLSDFTRFYAAEVAGGKYPYIDYDPDERWHQRIYRDRRLDVWLISWLPDQGTQLHDHGGSSGSFTVLSGTLTEAVVRGGRLRDNQRTAAATVAFGAHYVHDVRNLSDTPAISVHAYSPPLTTMTFYELADGRLEPLASLATDDPEPAFDTARAS